VLAYPSALGIPVIFVLTEDTEAGDPMLINGGASLHLDPETSVLRALAEAAQSRLSVIGGARESLDLQEGKRTEPYAMARARLTALIGDRGWADFDALPGLEPPVPVGPPDVALAAVLGRLRGGSLPLVVAADLAPAPWPFAVTKVVVPGAEVAHVHPTRVGARLRRARAARAAA
jgi:ribosomal protein S12 methylthiotransferase accessory factor YcaO